MRIFPLFRESARGQKSSFSTFRPAVELLEGRFAPAALTPLGSALKPWTQFLSGYSDTIIATGDPADLEIERITIHQDIDGLSITESPTAPGVITIRISGTPLESGPFVFSVTADDRGDEVTERYSIDINRPVTLSPAGQAYPDSTALTEWTVGGNAYPVQTITVSGGTLNGTDQYDVTIIDQNGIRIEPGVDRLNGLPVEVSGTRNQTITIGDGFAKPTSDGLFTFTVSAKDSVGADSDLDDDPQQYSIQFNKTPFLNDSIPGGFYGWDYDGSVESIDGTGQVKLTVSNVRFGTSGPIFGLKNKALNQDLASGQIVNGILEIAGTPTAADSFTERTLTFTVTPSDVAGTYSNRARTFTITIRHLPDGIEGHTYHGIDVTSFSPVVSGSWQATGLPLGLTFTADPSAPLTRALVRGTLLPGSASNSLYNVTFSWIRAIDALSGKRTSLKPVALRIFPDIAIETFSTTATYGDTFPETRIRITGGSGANDVGITGFESGSFIPFFPNFSVNGLDINLDPNGPEQVVLPNGLIAKAKDYVIESGPLHHVGTFKIYIGVEDQLLDGSLFPIFVSNWDFSPAKTAMPTIVVNPAPLTFTFKPKSVWTVGKSPPSLLVSISGFVYQDKTSAPFALDNGTTNWTSTVKAKMVGGSPRWIVSFSIFDTPSRDPYTIRFTVGTKAKSSSKVGNFALTVSDITTSLSDYSLSVSDGGKVGSFIRRGPGRGRG